MRRRLPAGLRWRLLLALLATSAVTLGVAALVVLPPMQDRLRESSEESLETQVTAIQPEFRRVFEELDESDPRPRDFVYQSRLGELAAQLNSQTNARVLVLDDDGQGAVEQEQFLYDSELFGEVPARALRNGLRVLRLGGNEVQREGDSVVVAVPIYAAGSAPTAVLIADLELTDVTALVEQVRNRFLIAAVVGLAVATLLAIALSSTLLRRLARLRAVALRITREGPDAPTPRDERRDEVGDLARALTRMQEELRRQEAARRAFVSTASHELRTPLTMLQGTMELLEEDIRSGRLDEDDALRQVSVARTELDRLSALAGELLDLSRLDAAVPLRSEPVELGEIVRAIAAEFELRARERATSIVATLPDGPCWGRGDPDAVARVVRILLDNALRYGPPGAPVRVEAHVRGIHAAIEVADEGNGIPPEERDRIFERFHRGAAAGSTGGFGLGLAIGRELARRMGGELEVVGDGSDGTRFALTLHAAHAPAEPPRRDRVSA
jgi:signal transduction histidine kinase